MDLSNPLKQHYDQYYSLGGSGRAPEQSEIHNWTHTWKEGSHILEVGCGEGVDAEALRQHGFRITGIDFSSIAIEKARNLYPEVRFLCEDLSDWTPHRQFGGILCRALSWYHYQLFGINRCRVDVPMQTKRMASWIEHGGSFLLIIATSLRGGSRGEGGIHDHTVSDFFNLFTTAGLEPKEVHWKDDLLIMRSIKP